MQLLFWKRKKEEKRRKETSKQNNKTTTTTDKTTTATSLAFVCMCCTSCGCMFVSLPFFYTSKGDGKQPATLQDTVRRWRQAFAFPVEGSDHVTEERPKRRYVDNNDSMEWKANNSFCPPYSNCQTWSPHEIFSISIRDALSVGIRVLRSAI